MLGLCLRYIVSIQSIDYIILSLSALNATLLTSLVNTLCFILLIVFCDFHINLMLFYEFFLISDV